MRRLWPVICNRATSSHSCPCIVRFGDGRTVAASPSNNRCFPATFSFTFPGAKPSKVLQIPGVVSLVSAGREPAALPSSEIESLRSSLPLRHFEPHPYLVVGERVRITAGSLEGMVGVLVRRKNDCRVVLTLELIMQSVAVEIGIDEIEPVKQ